MVTLIFLMYDLCRTGALFTILFADDTSVYSKAKNESMVISTLNEEPLKLTYGLKPIN